MVYAFIVVKIKKKDSFIVWRILQLYEQKTSSIILRNILRNIGNVLFIMLFIIDSQLLIIL